MSSSSERDRAVQIVREFAAAKGRQDVDAAQRFCHDDFYYEAASLGAKAEGKQAAGALLELFFQAFPDYYPRIEWIVSGEAGVALRGNVRMTLKGEFLGFGPTNKTAEIPMFCMFTFKDGLLASEVFFFDLLSWCDQIDIPVREVVEVTHKLFGGASASAA